jgi:TatA/E family protein of Tat protein translocase
MFGMSMPEILLILAVALIVIGPKKLPDLAKSLGRALGEFKKATSDFKDSISMDSTLNEVKDEFKDLGTKVKDPLASPSTSDKKNPEIDPTPGTTGDSETTGSDTDETGKTDEGQPNPEQESSGTTTPSNTETEASPEKPATSPDDVSPSDASTEGPLKDA